MFGELSMLPQPSSLESQADSGFSWQMCEVICGYGKCYFHPFSSFGDSVRNKLNVLELYKISILLFLTFCGKMWLILGQKKLVLVHTVGNSILVSLSCLELAFHTGMSHVTAIQTFLFKSSKHSVTDVWSPALIKCKHLVQYNARPI